MMFPVLSQLELSRTTIEEFLLKLVFLWGARLVQGLLIIIIARLALGFGQTLITRMLSSVPEKPGFLPVGKAKTLQILALSVWRYVIYAIAILLMLSNLGLNIAPFLAGAGILGLAVGFGAQNLVRDIITGFFIILEDQFSVGEYIGVGEFNGIVEELGLRITKIRDFGGELHIIPNGKIDAVTNFNRGAMRAQVDVGIAYEEDLDHALQVLDDLAAVYATEDPDVIEGPTVLGVISLDDSSVGIRLLARTTPMTQWKVERNLRRAIKNKFDEVGIEIPYPRRVYVDKGIRKEDDVNG